MNYTENYHLPQWEETDRIMRTDFNDAMANLEDGLTEEERRAYDRLCRLAYNHYCAANARGTFYRQNGMFHLDTSTSGEGLSGLVKFDGYYYMDNTTPFTSDSLFETFQQTPLTINGDQVTPMNLTFTPPSNGVFNLFIFWAVYYGNTAPERPCHITVTDLTENRVLLDTPFSLPTGESNATLYKRFYLSPEQTLYLHQGHRYQIITTSEGTPGTFELSIKRGGLNGVASVTKGSASATHTFRNPGANLGFVASVSFKPSKPTEDPRLFIGEEEIPAWWARDLADDGMGKAIREVTFRRSKPVEDGDVATLRLICAEDSELALHSWGVTLL